MAAHYCCFGIFSKILHRCAQKTLNFQKKYRPKWFLNLWEKIAIWSPPPNIGGVSLYLRESWAPDAEPILKYSNTSVDILCVYIPSKNVLICVIYRQPDDSTNGHPSTNKELTEILDKLSSPALFDKDISKNETWFNGSEFGHKTKPGIGLWWYLVY